MDDKTCNRIDRVCNVLIVNVYLDFLALASLISMVRGQESMQVAHLGGGKRFFIFVVSIYVVGVL